MTLNIEKMKAAASERLYYGQRERKKNEQSNTSTDA